MNVNIYATVSWYLSELLGEVALNVNPLTYKEAFEEQDIVKSHLCLLLYHAFDTLALNVKVCVLFPKNKTAWL